jgi:hypothetical protein
MRGEDGSYTVLDPDLPAQGRGVIWLRTWVKEEE